MSKTPFSSKCQVLGELWLYYREDSADHDEWAQFFAWADIALPLSYMLWQELAILPATDGGMESEQLIEQTWTTFCEMISIDPDAEYSSIADAWGASPNDPYTKVEVKQVKM